MIEPCPFCGETPEILTRGDGYYALECGGCGINTGERNGFDMAVKDWNTRHTPEQKPAKIEELKGGESKVRVTMEVIDIDPIGDTAVATLRIEASSDDCEGWFTQADLKACNAEIVEE